MRISLPSLALTLFLLATLHLHTGEAGRGGGRGGGGGRSSSSSRGWGSSSSKGWGGSRSAVSGGKSKFGKGLGGKLAKGAVIGAGAYAGYKLAKLSGKFIGAGLGYRFNDWNSWREADGMLCRRNTDCEWIDRSMYCQDYELDFSMSRAWFGGDWAAIVGECACPGGMFFNDNDMQCQDASNLGIGALIGIIIAAIAVISCCCCAAICYCFKRK